MSKCPGAAEATHANRVENGQCYCMWLNLKDTPWIPVKILHWAKSDAPDHPFEAPKQLKGIDPAYVLLVQNLSNGDTLTITSKRDKEGAVFHGDDRATFHKI